MSILTSLEDLPFSVWVKSSGSIWAYPMILTLHTFGMAMVAGVSAAIDIRLLGFASKIPIKPLERLYPLMWWGFGINLVTGSVLFMTDASTKMFNPDFDIKMILVFAGVWLLHVMRSKVFADPQIDQVPLTATTKRLAMLSLICWVGAVTAGRLLAYIGGTKQFRT